MRMRSFTYVLEDSKKEAQAMLMYFANDVFGKHQNS